MGAEIGLSQRKRLVMHDKTNKTVSTSLRALKHLLPSTVLPSIVLFKPKVPILGARNVWGTMRETSASAVITTLTN